MIMGSVRGYGVKRKLDEVWSQEDVKPFPNTQDGSQEKRMHYESPYMDVPDLWNPYQTVYLPNLSNFKEVTSFSFRNVEYFTSYRGITYAAAGTYHATNNKDLEVQPYITARCLNKNSLIDVGYSEKCSFPTVCQEEIDTVLNTHSTYPGNFVTHPDDSSGYPSACSLCDVEDPMKDSYSMLENSISYPEDSQWSRSRVDPSNRKEVYGQSTISPEFRDMDLTFKNVHLTRRIDANCESGHSARCVDSSSRNDSTTGYPTPAIPVELPVLAYTSHSNSSAPASDTSTKLPKRIIKKKMCTTCGKCFPTQYKLNAHMNTHTNNRPFRCNCGKTYAKKYCYTRHRKLHKKNFSCNTCGKTFVEHNMLENHKANYHCLTVNNQDLLLPTGEQQLLEQQHQPQRNGESFDQDQEELKKSEEELQELKESTGANALSKYSHTSPSLPDLETEPDKLPIVQPSLEQDIFNREDILSLCMREIW